MGRATRRALDLADIAGGVVLGIAGGIVATVILFVGIYWFLMRDPSPESEVRKYFASQDLGEVVTVEECGWIKDDSVTDMYWCDLTATRRVKLPHDRGFPAGRSRNCFFVPRANRSFLGDTDEDAIPLGVASRDGTCI